MDNVKNIYKDDPESRLLNMELVLDDNEKSMKEGVRTFVQSIITPFIDCQDWARIAEWNFDSVYGFASRHDEMCNSSLDKSKEELKKYTREDVGTEISKGKLSASLFKVKAQTLNCRRSKIIVTVLEDEYKKIFDKDYVPKSKRGNVTDKVYVDKAEKDMMLAEANKLLAG
jgi:hypothetical protein